jgi:iron complex outermembrane receptor protein
LIFPSRSRRTLVKAFNNLFNSSAITGDTITGTASPLVINANGTTYTDPFNTNGPTPMYLPFN